VYAAYRHHGPALAASTAFGATQDKTMPEGENLAQRCAPKVISRKHAKLPSSTFARGKRIDIRRLLRTRF